jgi:hypothetical protein
MQLRTTLNVDTWEWMDYAHIGLQVDVSLESTYCVMFQISHQGNNTNNYC